MSSSKFSIMHVTPAWTILGDGTLKVCSGPTHGCLPNAGVRIPSGQADKDDAKAHLACSGSSGSALHRQKSWLPYVVKGARGQADQLPPRSSWGWPAAVLAPLIIWMRSYCRKELN
jgi:hypothetical protein